MVRGGGGDDRVSERETACALAREPFDQFLDGNVRDRLVEPEAGGVANGQQVDERAEVLRDGLAQHDSAAAQGRERCAPCRRVENSGLFGHV